MFFFERTQNSPPYNKDNPSFNILKCYESLWRKNNDTYIRYVNRVLDWIDYSENYYEWDIEELEKLILDLNNNIDRYNFELNSWENATKIYKNFLWKEIKKLNESLEKCKKKIAYLKEEYEKNTQSKFYFEIFNITKTTFKSE